MPEDTTSPPAQVETNCEKCGGNTKLLSFIPRLGQEPAYRIFECGACTAITWVVEKVMGE